MPPRPKKLLPPLAALVLLSACAKTSPPAPIALDKLCASWRHQTITATDNLSNPTAAQIEGNNKSRPAWGCAYGANRVASASGVGR